MSLMSGTWLLETKLWTFHLAFIYMIYRLLQIHYKVIYNMIVKILFCSDYTSSYIIYFAIHAYNILKIIIE